MREAAVARITSTVKDRSTAKLSRWRAFAPRVASLALTVFMGIAVLAIVGFIFLIEVDVPTSEVPLQGTVTAWSQGQSEHLVASNRVFVRLDDGRIVEAHASGSAIIRVGTRVVVLEETTRVLRRTTYRFGGPLEEAPPIFR
ncbi:MAG TPA: hypothetical protein VN203_09310 [Candidatus Acidoferrum sp.]|nr:hypothetical protein [Candidatus Acidoferrum sp.]